MRKLENFLFWKRIVGLPYTGRYRLAVSKTVQSLRFKLNIFTLIYTSIESPYQCGHFAIKFFNFRSVFELLLIIKNFCVFR